MMEILIKLTKEQYKSVKNCPFTNQEKAISEGIIIIDDDEITRQSKIEVLTELQLEIEEKATEICDDGWWLTYNNLIQEKINELEAEIEPQESEEE